MWHKTGAKLDQLHTRLYGPYEALQRLGCRLAGQKPVNRWAQVTGLLLPVLVFCAMLGLELILAGYILLRYGAERPWLIIPLAVLMAIPLSPYIYRVLFDTWRAYRLLKKVPKTNLTGSEQ